MSSQIQPFEEVKTEADTRRANNDITYRARPFTELVDEDKHGFVKRRFISTLLGGYRYVQDEQETEFIPITQHLAQLLVLIIPPVVIGVISSVVSNLAAAVVISGALLVLFNGALMTLRWKKGEMFLVPHRGMVESIVCIIITFLYGAAMTYLLHTSTFEYYRPVKQTSNLDHRTEPMIMCLVMIGFSGYSLFSYKCPETAIYRDNESEFGLGSNHY